MDKKALCAFILASAALSAMEECQPVMEECQPVCVPAYIDSCECCPGPQVARLTARHIEPGGVGYSDGYTSADFFWAPNLGANVYGFVDARGHVFNDGKWAANLGLGLRYLFECTDLVTGINVYGDYRQGRHHHHKNFYQIGVGGELLWPCWDIRVNGYVPVGKTHERFKSGFQGFKGHEAITFRKWEVAMWGVDAGLGYWLYRGDCVGLHATIGGYYFKQDDFDKHAGGGIIRARLDLWDWLEVRGQVSYDNLFKWKGQGELALNFSFGCPVKRYERRACSCCTILNLEERLVEQPERFEIIVLSDKKKTAPALSPITGLPLQFIFVDNTAHSDGTIEHPFPTLVQAQNASKPTDVIYVFPGDGTDNGMNQGIILKDDQILTSSFLPFPIHSIFGDFVIPASSTTRPLISNVNNEVVRLANRDTVQGFRINKSQGSSVGILGFDPIEDFTLISNIITVNKNTGNAIGVFINDFTGKFFAQDNTITVTAPAIADGITFIGTVVNGDVTLLNNAISASSSLDEATAFVIEGPNFTGNLHFLNNQFEAAANQNALGVAILDFQGTADLSGNQYLAAAEMGDAQGIQTSFFNGSLSSTSDQFSVFSTNARAIGFFASGQFTGELNIQNGSISSAGDKTFGIATSIFNGTFIANNNLISVATNSVTADAFGIDLNTFNGTFIANNNSISAASTFNGGYGIFFNQFDGTVLANNNSISATSDLSLAAAIFLNGNFNGEFNLQANSLTAVSPMSGVGIFSFVVFTGDIILQSNLISSQFDSSFFMQLFSGTALITDNIMTQIEPTAVNANVDIRGSNMQAKIVDNVLTSTASNNRAFIMSNTAGTSHLKLTGNTISSPAFTDDGHFTRTAGTFEVESTNGAITGVEALNNNARLTQTGVITYVPVTP